MEVPGATREQLLAVYRSMSPAQRWGLILCTAAIGGWLCWLLLRPASSGMVPAFGGRELSPSEVDELAEQFDAAGLVDYETDGSRLLVPQSAVDKYNAVAEADTKSTRSWGAAWREANSSLSDFALTRQRKDAGEIARAELLSKLLGDLPGIDSAEIVWDEEPRIGWRKPPKVRATVYLKPLEGHVLSPETVEAVRTAVAGSKAHLDPADVAVMDMQSLITYAGGESIAPEAGAPESAAQFTAACRGRVEHALAHISGVRVSVVVTEAQVAGSASENGIELPTVASNRRMELPQFDDAAEQATPQAAAMNEVSVRVSVPQSHFDEVLAERTNGREIANSQLMSVRREVEQFVVEDVNQRVFEALADQVAGMPNPFVEVGAYLDRPQSVVQAPVSEPDAAAWVSGMLQNHRWTAWGLATVMLGIGLWSVSWMVRRLFRDRSARMTSSKQRETVADAPEQTADDGRLATGNSLSRSAGSDVSTDGDLSAAADSLAGALSSLLEEPGDTSGAAGAGPEVQAATVHQSRFAVADERSLQSDSATSIAAGSRLPESESAANLIQDIDRPDPTAIVSPGPGKRSLDAPDETPVDIEEILRCDPQRLCRLFQQTSSDTWAMALVGASDAVQEHLSETLARDDSNRLRQALRSRRPVRLHDVESAQREILSGLAIDLA